MPSLNLSASEVELIEKHRKAQQISGNITDAERQLLDAARNRRYSLDDVDRWSELTPLERETVRKQIADRAAEAMSGQ